MSTTTQYPHLSIESDGSVRIAGGRYKVVHLAGEHYHYGWTAEELLRQHPDLQPEEVYVALTYFYDHYSELVEEICREAEIAETGPKTTTLSRDDLLRHRNCEVW